jgi:hypothetical protein
VALDTKTQQRIDLLVGYDKNSYTKTRTALADLFEKKFEGEITLPEGALKSLADKFLEASQTGGKGLAEAFATKFDSEVGTLLKQFTKLREDIFDADAAGDVSRMIRLKDEQALLEAKINATTEEHKKQVDAAKKLKEAFQFGNVKDVGEKISTGFFDSLNKAKAGDLAGFSDAVLGGVSKMAGSAGKAAGAQASTMEAGALATSLEGAAAALGATAAVLTGVAVAVGVVVAAFSILDDAQKDLNKSMLEGASQADFAMQAQGSLIANMEGSMEAGRKAAIDMAFEFRGTGEEMTGILAQLNQAGFSYKEMEKDIKGAGDKQTAYKEAIKSTFVWSTALGLSVSEVATATAEWSEDFGAGLTQISENFTSISKFAMEGGFNVKRFFTAVSQATSGMAIYNARMEEAAFFLAKTQKILGGTDASAFIQSLTKGFAGESIMDRVKQILIANKVDPNSTAKIFSANAERAAESFSTSFKDSAELKGAFKDTKLEFVNMSDPKELANAWGKMDGQSRRQILSQLRKGTSEQVQAAARQLQTLGNSLDAQEGGFAAQTRGMAALDMQGKLAFKLQTINGKRLNESSAEELAAYEQYQGISGEALEQMMRVEDQLYADYEQTAEFKKQGKDGFLAWVASNKDATVKLDEVKGIQESAEYFAQQNVENTRSVFAVLKNTIAVILNNIYDTLTAWFGQSKQLSAEEVDKVTAGLTKISVERKASTERLDAIEDALAEADKVLKTTGDLDPEHIKAKKDMEDLEAQKKGELGKQEFLQAQARRIQLMDKAALGSTTDATALARQQLTASGEATDIYAKYATPEQVAEVKESIAAIDTHEQRKAAGDQRALMTHGMPTDSSSVVMDAFDAATSKSDEIALDGNKMLAQYAFAGGKGLADISAEQKKEIEDHIRAFPADVTKAVADGTRKANAEKLAAGLEYEKGTADYDKFVSDIMMGNFTPHKKYLDTMGLGEQVKSDFGVDLSKVADPNVGQDFVMRPGQRAQRFNPSDTILGMKGGGPLVGGQGGGGGTVNITINGGDQSAVYQTVKAALKNSGMKGA